MGARENGARAKRTPRGSKRKAEVQRAATDLFHRQGYDGTSVEDIAQALGILKGSLYYYISSKEDLLYGIVAEVHEDVQGIVEDSLDRVDLPPLDRIAYYVRKQTGYNLDNVTQITVYYREMGKLGKKRLDAIHKQRRSQHRAMREVLIEAREAEEIDPAIDVDLTTHCVFATVNWIYAWWRPGVAPEAAAIDACVSFVTAGVPGASPLGRRGAADGSRGG